VRDWRGISATDNSLLLITARSSNLIVYLNETDEMKKGHFALFSVFILVSIIVASCTQPPVEFKCTDALGCVEIPPGEPVHIAYALVISGPDETIGIDSRNGIEIAIADKGQILGHDILLSGEDELCTPEGGRIASTKLALNQTTIAVIGTSCAEAGGTAIPILSQAGLLVVSPSNSDFDLTQAGNENQYPGYARTVYPDMIQGKTATNFAYQVLGAEKVATIHDGSNKAVILQRIFVENLKELGGTVTAQVMIDPTDTNFNLVLTEIASGGPDLIYYPLSSKTGSLITRQARDIPGLEGTALMGADGMFSPDMVERAGEAVEGLYVSGPDFSQFREIYKSDFIPQYIDRFGNQPSNIFHAHAYDAFMLIADVIEKAGVLDQDGTLHIPRQALRMALYNTTDYQGLTGNLSCTASGECADTHIAIYQYQLGEFPPIKIWP
jgi:branched-chain amino acid transport system substrate-binding protein